jgi:NAD(P)-dependent dehydrogenase (short-subunit alcohol dehydrogenase family)
MLATYSGSKAFLASWTQALADEYKSKGIMVQLVNTYFVVCSFTCRVFPPDLGYRFPKCPRFVDHLWEHQPLKHSSNLPFRISACQVAHLPAHLSPRLTGLTLSWITRSRLLICRVSSFRTNTVSAPNIVVNRF